jgi:hypothetical protein
MHKTREISDSMIKQYLSSSIVCGQVEEKRSEGYELSYSANTMHIRADCSLASVWAAKQASMALKSGFISEVLGRTEPLYPLRPLWIQAGDIAPSLQRWIPLGFNALVVEEVFKVPEGVQVIRRPRLDRERGFSPFDAGYVQYLKETLGRLECDALLWESRYNDPSFFCHEDGEFLTRVEILEQEMRLLETVLDGARLIYYLPKHQQFNEAKQSRWLRRLCCSAGKNTIIAFSQPLFWKEIRQSLDPITTPLMPVIPAETSCDELGRLFSQMCGHSFHGVLTLVKSPPKDDMLLWIIGQLQLRHSSPQLLADIWDR